MAAYGMIQQATTLAAARIITGETVLEYGEDEIGAMVDAAYRAANVEMQLLVSRWCTVTNIRAKRVDGSGLVEVEELTSNGRAQGETFESGSEVGFPLRKFGKALGWNRDALRVTTVAEFAKWNMGIIIGDRRNVIRRIKRAFYSPTSYTFYDRLLDGAALEVKALANGATEGIPIGPNGEEFDATHNHYLARAGGALTPADMDRLVGTLTEHYDEAEISIVIDPTNEGAVRGLTGFSPLLYANTQVADSVQYDTSGVLNPMKTKDRKIGNYNGIEVYVHYTAVPNYIRAEVIGAGIDKPLAIRVRGRGIDRIGGDLDSILAGGDGTQEYGFGDLQLVYDHEDYPLRATEWQREFDVAVHNRIGAAVLYIGGTTYVAPNIT